MADAAYGDRRGARRRELEDSRAAINHHRREGLCSEIVSVVLPPRTGARERWLTRAEAARLALGALGEQRQVMRDKDTLRAVGRHVARFILVGLYTGTRSSAICGAALMPTIGRGHVDLEQGVFYRRAIGRTADQEASAAGEATAAAACAYATLAAAWAPKKAVVEWNGKPVESVRKGFAAAVRAAGLGAEVTPHILRHTCATWLMQRGVNLSEAAGFLGMTCSSLSKVTGTIIPIHQEASRRRITGTVTGHRNTVNKARQTSTNVTKID